MAYIFIQPTWFFTYSVILEIIFAAITFLVSFYSFKVYRLTEERQAKIFGFAFLSISGSYIVEAILNFILLAKFDSAISSMIQLQSVYLLNLFGIYAHALFFIIGIIFLTYVTLKIKSLRVLTLLIALVIVSVFFSTNKVFMFYMLSSVLLIFTAIHYYQHCMIKRNRQTITMFIAMLFLLFGSFIFVLAIRDEIYYVIGHILQLISFLLILTNMFKILKNDKEKR